MLFILAIIVGSLCARFSPRRDDFWGGIMAGGFMLCCFVVVFGLIKYTGLVMEWLIKSGGLVFLWRVL